MVLVLLAGKNTVCGSCFAHQGELLQTWRGLQEKAGDDSLVDVLSQFYDTLLSTWHSQVEKAV